MNAWVYIIASRPAGALFIGTTPDLMARVAAHRGRTPAGFGFRHAQIRLVWYTGFEADEDAAAYARALRRRHWHGKARLIEAMNPDWDDLFGEIAAV